MPKTLLFLYDVLMFFPTAQEVLLLKLIQKNEAIAEKDALAIHQNPQMFKALEGCLVKGFVELDAAGALMLTEEGGACI